MSSALPYPSTSYAYTSPYLRWLTTPCSRIPSVMRLLHLSSVCASSASIADDDAPPLDDDDDCSSMAAVRPSSTAICALAGMKKPKMVASSLGRNAERTRPVPLLSGLPMPIRLSVSVPVLVCRWKVYSFGR